jgi:hypothetical protein
MGEEHVKSVFRRPGGARCIEYKFKPIHMAKQGNRGGVMRLRGDERLRAVGPRRKRHGHLG